MSTLPLVALLAVLTAVRAPAQQRDLGLQSIVAKKQVALVIGNSAYSGQNYLKNPVNDAEALAVCLRELNFKVQLLKDGSRRAMNDAIRDFVSELGREDVALFYYAGHGVQVDGENYLIPADFEGKNESDVLYESIAVGKIQDALERSQAQLRILILDACRNQPPAASGRSVSRGFAPMERAARGTFIAFATAPGSVAADSPETPNGLFTRHLLAALRTPGLSLDDVFNVVRQQVDSESHGKQVPWSHSSVIGRYAMNGNLKPLPAMPPSVPTAPTPTVSPDVTAIREFRFRYQSAFNTFISTGDITAMVGISVEKFNTIAPERSAENEQRKFLLNSMRAQRQIVAVFRILSWNVQSINGDEATVAFEGTLHVEEMGVAQDTKNGGIMKLAKIRGEWVMASGGVPFQ